MAPEQVTTALIEEYLDRADWPSHRSVDESDQQEGFVITTVPRDSEATYTLIINPVVEKDGLRFRVQQIATAPQDATPSDRLRGLLLAIGTINSKLILGAFAYDADDGELMFKLGVPIAGGEFSYDNFHRCLRSIEVTVGTYAAALQGIIDGTRTAGDVIG